MADILKVSVLAGGELLLDGRPVALSELEAAMTQVERSQAAVWYYREDADGEPPAVAMDVMKLIVSNRLPVRLSTKPDFSDAVAPPDPGLEKIFAVVREKAAQRNLVVVRPDRRHLLLPAMDKKAIPAEAVASVERMLPSSVKRNVAAVADTAWSMADTPGAGAANQAIPFFGLLMGFTAIGHAVWIYDAGAGETLSAGAHEADVLIVDSARVPALPAEWQKIAAQVMRAPHILIHDRAIHRLRKP